MARKVILEEISDQARVKAIIRRRRYNAAHRQEINAKKRLRLASCYEAKKLQADYGAKWQRNNRAKRNEAAKRYRERHRETVLERMRAAYYVRKCAAETKKATERYKRWRANNPEQAQRNARQYVITRRSKLHGAKGTCSVKQRNSRFGFFGWRCIYCHVPLSKRTVTTDHLIPLARGGTNWPANIAPACKSCNCKKGSRTFSEYVRTLKVLSQLEPPLASLPL